MLPAKLQYTRCTRMLRKIFAEYGVQFGYPVQRYNITRTDEIKVLQGGVSTHDFPEIREDIHEWLNREDEFGQPKLRFLTNRKERVNYRGQIDHLHFLAGIVNEDMTLTLFLQYYTPTEGLTKFVNIFNYNNIREGEVYHLPIGHISLQQHVPANALFYRVWLRMSDNSWESEVITVHRKPAVSGLTILEYQNSLGAVETIGLPWTRKRLAEVSKSYFEKNLSLEYNTDEARRLNYDEMLMQSFDLSINQAQEPGREWLVELLMSPQVHLISGVTRIPVTIAGDKLNMELQNEAGQFFPTQKITVHLENQIAFSRIINLTNIC